MNVNEPIPLLTAEQKALVVTGHGAVERARLAARRDHGDLLEQVTDAQLMTEGMISLGFSAQSFKPARGSRFEDWAFYHAWYAMLDLARDDGRYARIKAKMRAAIYQYLQNNRASADDIHDETPAIARAHVAAFTDGAAMAVLAHLGMRPARGEADILEREAVMRAERALTRVVDELRPEHLRLLELHFVNGYPLNQIADALGDGYRRLLDEFHELLARMGARLRTLGLHEPPPTLDAMVLPRTES